MKGFLLIFIVLICAGCSKRAIIKPVINPVVIDADPPPQAVAAGYTYLAFRDEFNSDEGIDMNNTGNPGYNFYRRRPFGYPVLDRDRLSVSNGMLILNSQTPGPNLGIVSIARQNGQTDGWTGFTARDGAYFEARISFDGKPSGTGLPAGQSVGWPSFWSMAAEHLYGNAKEWIECDFFEMFFLLHSPYYGGVLHKWVLPNKDVANNESNMLVEAGVVNWSEFKTMGTLWTTGPGSTVDFYYNDQLKTVNPLTGSPWEFGNEQSWPVILGSDNWPMRVDFVRVWTKPPLEDGAIYEIKPVNAADKRLEANGGSGNDGTAIQANNDTNTDSQRWKAIYTRNGYYEFEPVNALGKRLNVAGGLNTPGTIVQLLTANSSTAQRWRLIATHMATFELEPECAFGKRLDALDVINVKIGADTDTGNQRWIFEKVDL